MIGSWVMRSCGRVAVQLLPLLSACVEQIGRSSGAELPFSHPPTYCCYGAVAHFVLVTTVLVLGRM